MLSLGDAPKEGDSWSPPAELDARIRRFGKYPNILDWLPGDILLVSEARPNWVVRNIISTQEKRFASQYARWQHAGLYLGNGYLVEATTHGVKYTPVDHYVGGHHLLLRRNPELSEKQRWLVAIEASGRIGNSYRFADILSIYRRSFPGFARQVRPSVLIQTKSVICSQLCQDAHARVTNKLIVSLSINPVTPAALAQSAALVDVPLHWNAIR